nr:GGDEF domain-containing protein [Synergistaceae bacterium]
DVMGFSTESGKGKWLFPLLPEEREKTLPERLRNIVAAEDYPPVPVVTASFGVVEFREYHQGLGSLEQEADMALYRAKTSGKNRVELYGPDFGKE